MNQRTLYSPMASNTRIPPHMGWRNLICISALALMLAGCGDSDTMSQKEVEYHSHMDQAQFFRRQGELKASTQELRSAMEIRAEEVEPHLLLIENMLIAGDGVTAESKIKNLKNHLEKQQEINPDLKDRLTILNARALLAQERHDSALTLLAELSTSDQELQLQKQLLSGDAYRQQARYEQAEEAYRQAHQLNEEAVMPLLGLSRARYAQQDKEGALEWLEKARKLDENDSEVWLWQARMAHREGQLEKARDAYTQALEDIGRYDVMTQKKYLTISSLIDVLQQQGNTSEAFVYEEILASSAPGTIRSSIEEARDQYQRGNLDKAASHLEEVLNQAPSHESASILLGMIRFQQGNVQSAEKLLSPYAEENNSAELTKMLAATRIRLKRSEEAIAMLEELDPEQSDPSVVALVGIAALAGEDHEMGRKLIDKSLEMAPDNGELRARYSRYLLSQGEPEQAEKLLRTGIRHSPENDSLRILLAQLHLQQGEGEKAIAVTDEWRKEQPENIRAVSSSGDVAQALGDTKGARELYRKAIEIDPEGYESHFALGGLEARDGNREQAIQHLRQAVSAAPEQQKPMNALIALSRTDEKQLTETMDFLQALTQEQEGAIRPRLLLLRYHLQQERYDQAGKLADNLTRIFADDEMSHQQIGAVYQDLATAAINNEQLERAQRLLRLGRERFRQHEGLALVDARLQFLRERPREAREILRKVKAENPDSPRPYFIEASHLMAEKQFREAAEQFSLAHKTADTPETLTQLAHARRQAGEKEKSMALLKEGTRHFPDSDHVWLHLAMVHQTEGRQEQAIEAYKRALALAPDNSIALNNLAWLYHEMDHKEALPLAEKAYRLNPGAAEVADTYGWILFQQGELEKSIRVLENARALAPDSQEISRHLAEAYRKAGREEEAQAL